MVLTEIKNLGDTELQLVREEMTDEKTQKQQVKHLAMVLPHVAC